MAPLPKFSHLDLLTMASSSHLTGKQINTIAADLRVKLGRDVVETGFDTAMIMHNNQYAEYFSAEKKMFWNLDGNVMEKTFFWCTRSKDFLKFVALVAMTSMEKKPKQYNKRSTILATSSMAKKPKQ